MPSFVPSTMAILSLVENELLENFNFNNEIYEKLCDEDIMNFIATHPSIAKFKLSSASIKCCLTRHSDYIREMVNQKYKCELIYPEPDWTHALKLTSERKKLVEFIGFNFNRDVEEIKSDAPISDAMIRRITYLANKNKLGKFNRKEVRDVIRAHYDRVIMACGKCEIIHFLNIKVYIF